MPNQLSWVEIVPGEAFDLGGEIRCAPISLRGSLPYYAGELGHDSQGQASIGLIFERDGRRLAYTPSVPEIDHKLLAIYGSCDAILVDGTFWSDTELSSTQAGTPLAREIGHLPMSGEQGTIALLKNVTRPEKVFVHINNTNPVLDPRSPERRMVEDAGWQVAHDGWQWNS